MSKPIAVLISDIHYNIHTLPFADAALRQAVHKANDLSVPLIVAGDLHDTKANLRGECVNAMIDTFKLSNEAYVLIGNHDKINEKSEGHSLNFLNGLPNIFVIDAYMYVSDFNLHLFPYYSSVEELRRQLNLLPSDEKLIMHQGLKGSDSGDYLQDYSAITHEDVEDFRVISGHYHRRQDIKTGHPRKGHVGMFSYIGNPYTLGFGEAKHPEKGFQILMDDGRLEFVLTNLRKHIIFEEEIFDKSYLKVMHNNYDSSIIKPADLVWLKIKGPKNILNLISKKDLDFVTNRTDFKLDLIPTDTESKYTQKTQEFTQVQLLDDLIDHKSISKQEKELIKKLWRGL
jgi:DNA repair exonuclease SbcCD nuclease subunit